MLYPGANIFSVITIAANANYCGLLLPNPLCQLSLLEETGLPGENPRLSTSIDLLLFTLTVRTGFKKAMRKKVIKKDEKIMKKK